MSKEELRAQVEKLERANATLRTKNRDAGRAARDATARVADLEQQLEQLQKKVDAKPAAPRRGRPPGGGRSRAAERDPGDSVPEGVAVQDPEPPDEEAETARENLEEHLSSD